MSDRNEKKGLFVAVGQSMQRLWSTDGEHWSQPQLGKPGEVLREVCFGNGRFVAVGYTGGRTHVGASPDGVNWKTATITPDGDGLHGVAFGNGIFLAGGGDPPYIRTTQDGVVWSDRLVFDKAFPTAPGVPESRSFLRMKFGNDRFLALGQRGWRGTSKDGKEWKPAADIKPTDALIDAAWGNGVFVGTGLNGLRITSIDGIKWTDRVVGEEGEHINTILWTGDRFVGIGAGATYFSHDGHKWERRENKNAPLRAAYGNGIFVGCHWKGRVLRSNDAVTWTQVMQCDNHIEGLAFGDRV